MIDFLASLPLWLLAFVLNLLLMGFAAGGLWVARRWVVPWMNLQYHDAYVGAVVVQSVMVLYCLIAALTTVGVWTKYSQVADVVSAEATAIAACGATLAAIPNRCAGECGTGFRGYTDQVINGAWPQQRRGKIPREGVEWMDRLQADLFAFEPASEGQKIYHAETLRAFNNMNQARRQRLDAVHSGLPGVMWTCSCPVRSAACCSACSSAPTMPGTRERSPSAWQASSA